MAEWKKLIQPNEKIQIYPAFETVCKRNYSQLVLDINVDTENVTIIDVKDFTDVHGDSNELSKYTCHLENSTYLNWLNW